jgi:hypothetical protein
MKFKSILAIVATVALLASCSQEHLDPLTGKYAAPTPYEFTSLANQSIEKLTGKRIFTVEVATNGVTGSEGSYTGSGEVMHMEFVGDAYFLQSTAFTPGADAGSAVKNNYIVGTATSGTRLFKVSGGSATAEPVKSGSITVSANGAIYTISGNLWLESGEVIKISFRGEIVYEVEIDVTTLTNLFSIEPKTNGILYRIATEGVSGSAGAMGMTYTGTGNFLQVVFHSTDGTLAPGTYTAGTYDAMGAGVTTPGTFGSGYDPMPEYGWLNEGSVWFTVNNGAATGVHVNSGTITVTKDGDNYTIYGNFGSYAVEYTGPLTM